MTIDERISVDRANGADETVIWIRVQRPDTRQQEEDASHIAQLSREIDALRKRLADAERVARDAGQANAEAIAAAVRDAMAKLAVEFTNMAGPGLFGCDGLEVLEACAKRARELTK